MLKLRSGIAWKLEVASHPHRKEIPQEYRAFSNDIAVGKPPIQNARGNSKPTFRFKPVKGLRRFRQRTCWKFFSKNNPDLIFELSRFDDWRMARQPEKQTGPDVETALRRQDTTWDACLYSSHWEEQLGKYGILTEKGPDHRSAVLDALFPPRWDEESQKRTPGMQIFVETVQKICAATSAALPWPGH